MGSLNFTDIRNKLTTSQVFEFLNYFHGEPIETSFGLISRTICHNEAGEGSKKLYYYDNSHLFTCYTQCGENFDIFELLMRVYKIQYRTKLNLPEAYDYICNFFQISEFLIRSPGDLTRDTDLWSIFNQYDKVAQLATAMPVQALRVFDDVILDRLTYPKIQVWINEGMSEEVLIENRIGYYPSMAQISIPHYNKDGEFVGLRGRSLLEEHIALYGKYHPLLINDILYSHPLGKNLYNLNNSKTNIQNIKTAIVFEGEKSTLLYASYFGKENDISVACCGSSLSKFQVDLLLDTGASEMVIAFDKDFHDGEVNQKLINRLEKINKLYKSKITVSFLYDKEGLLDYKESPIDKGKETFMELFKNRIYL